MKIPRTLTVAVFLAVFLWFGAIPSARAADRHNAPTVLDSSVVFDDGVASPYIGPTPYHAVAVQDFTWSDAARDRSVPVRVYWPALGDGPFPVIIFSTGLGRSRDDCAYLGRYWAMCGYVSVHVQHPGSGGDVVRGVRPRKNLRSAFDDPANISDRPRDLIFVIDQIEHIQREGTPLGHRLDLDRIGVSGHDFGAQSALALAGQVLPGDLAFVEPRVKAVVAMSSPVPLGQVPLSVAYGNIAVPCLHISGTDDNSVVATTKASQRRLPFDYSDGADQYLVIFRGADHMTYSGHVFPLLNVRADRVFQGLIARSSAAFWDAYLKDDLSAKRWLADDGLHAMLGSKAAIEKKIGR